MINNENQLKWLKKEATEEGKNKKWRIKENKTDKIKK